ncbi:MAG: rod shape-determining protein [Clostridia bacterium]|nr:rod shape-determining protein [Clostridia bacterium]
MSKDKYAIDFDSAFTSIYKIGGGLVLSEPTVAAIDSVEKNTVRAIGQEASKLIGKTGKETKIVFPVFEGEIVNEKVASELLCGFLKKTGIKTGIFGAQAIFSLPCGATIEMVEKYKRVAKNAGLSKVYFAESPRLSVIGQRIPINDSAPCFVIDMGGGATNIAAVSSNGIIAGLSVNFGINKINVDIIDYIADKNGLQIGLQTADRLRKEIGSLEEGDTLPAVVNGRDVKDGTPRAFPIKSSEIEDAIKLYYDKIAEIAIAVLGKLPPEVSAEIRNCGIYVSGGGASIYGLQKYYEDKFDVQVNVADNCQYSVALGGGMVMSNKELLKKIAIKIN